MFSSFSSGCQFTHTLNTKNNLRSRRSYWPRNTVIWYKTSMLPMLCVHTKNYLGEKKRADIKEDGIARRREEPTLAEKEEDGYPTRRLFNSNPTKNHCHPQRQRYKEENRTRPKMVRTRRLYNNNPTENQCHPQQQRDGRPKPKNRRSDPGWRKKRMAIQHDIYIK